MKIILAVDNNWAIGKDNGMLFHIPSDLKHFKSKTLNNVVIMGRNTYESMGSALPDRENIVLTRNTDYKLEDAKVFNSPDYILSYIKDSDKEVFVIGGSQIVDIFLPYCDEAIITKIYDSRKADTFLHNFDEDDDFKITCQSDLHEENGHEFRYINYKRK